MDVLTEQLLNRQLHHALALGGFRTTEVGEIGSGDYVYTSDNVKQKFLESIKSQDTFRPILNKIVNLIETDRIVGVYVKVGLINKIIYHFFKNKKKFAESRFILAFYDFKSNKVFCLVENINNTNYWKKQEALSLVILHELQHQTSVIFPKLFLTIHNEALTVYFKQFFMNFFDISITDKEAKKFYDWLHYYFENKEGQETDIHLKDYVHLMISILHPYTKKNKNLKLFVNGFFEALLMYIKSPSNYAKAVHDKSFFAYKLFDSLNRSYKALNIKIQVHSLCIQEVIFPSEVICIESEYNTKSRHFELVKKIE